MSTIKLKRSAVAGKVPTTASLALGEVALNTYDGKLYIKKDVGGVESIVSFAGAAGASSAAESTVYLDTGTGDGTTATFTMSVTPAAEQNIFVYLNGVLQHTSEYSYLGPILTFTTAPELDDEIEVRIIATLSAAVSIRDYKNFLYTFATSQQTFTGADDNGDVLAYDVGKVEVYANGIRLVNGDDYTATGGTSIVLQQPITSGIVEIVSLARAAFLDRDALNPVESALTTTDVNQVADAFLATTYRTAKYLVQMSTSTAFHSTEVLLIHDGTTVYMTEFGTIYSGSSLGTIDGDIVGGEVRLLVSPANVDTTVKAQRLTVAV